MDYEESYPAVCREVGLTCEACISHTAGEIARCSKGLQGKILGQLISAALSESRLFRMHAHSPKPIAMHLLARPGRLRCFTVSPRLPRLRFLIRLRRPFLFQHPGVFARSVDLEIKSQMRRIGEMGLPQVAMEHLVGVAMVML